MPASLPCATVKQYITQQHKTQRENKMNIDKNDSRVIYEYSKTQKEIQNHDVNTLKSMHWRDSHFLGAYVQNAILRARYKSLDGKHAK